MQRDTLGQAVDVGLRRQAALKLVEQRLVVIRLRVRVHVCGTKTKLTRWTLRQELDVDMQFHSEPERESQKQALMRNGYANCVYWKPDRVRIVVALEICQ